MITEVNLGETEGSFIRVAGVFDTYEDEEYLYCTLRNAVME